MRCLYCDLEIRTAYFVGPKIKYIHSNDYFVCQTAVFNETGKNNKELIQKKATPPPKSYGKL